MTNKEFERAKKRIRKYVDKWRNLLGLWNWSGLLHWSNKRKTIEDHDLEALADVHSNWEYLNYDITFYLPCFIKTTERDIERCVMHEMMHIVVHEMRGRGIKHEERVVSHLTNALERVFQEGQKKPIKPVKNLKKK